MNFWAKLNLKCSSSFSSFYASHHLIKAFYIIYSISSRYLDSPMTCLTDRDNPNKPFNWEFGGGGGVRGGGDGTPKPTTLFLNALYFQSNINSCVSHIVVDYFSNNFRNFLWSLICLRQSSLFAQLCLQVELCSRNRPLLVWIATKCSNIPIHPGRKWLQLSGIHFM